MNNNAKTIAGILAAGAVGVALGMLLAPQKGSETRKAIKEKFDGSSDDLMATLSDLVESGKQLLETGKEKYTQLKHDATEKASGLKEDASSRFNEIKSELKNEGANVKGSLS